MVLKTGGSRWSLPSSSYSQGDVRYRIIFVTITGVTEDSGKKVSLFVRLDLRLDIVGNA